ncbi:hypothetical protein SNARM312S_08256 [Streptomyces narbonensis]
MHNRQLDPPRSPRAIGHQGRALRRHPRRRLPRGGPRHRLHPRQPRHRRAARPPSGSPRSSPSSATRSPSASTCAGTTLRGRGSTRDGGDLYETLARLDAEGCARYVVTDIAKDGTLQGPNLELLKNVCAATDKPVVASGGVSSLDDLRAISELVPLGVEGAIVGKALYAKAFTLEEALATVAAV